MNIFLKTFLVLTCCIFLSANTTQQANISTFEQNILEQLDIDLEFANTVYFKDISDGIKDGHIKSFDDAIRNGQSFLSMLRTSIVNSGLPDSLFYLAMVESGLSNKVISRTKATGIWQFMAPTARIYGLRVDKYVDERKDPIQSSVAATRYLRSLKREFGKWYLAILAYNCGNTKLKKAIRQAGSDDLAVLLDSEKKYIPYETRNFIIKILRSAFIAQDLGFDIEQGKKLEAPEGVKLARVSVPGGTNLLHVADSIGLSLKKMKENNVHLNFVFTPPNAKSYHIYIPENKRNIFVKNFIPQKAKNEFYTYKVKKGDTLFSISKKTGVNYRAIREYNELETNSIKTSQLLIIPKSVRLNRSYTAQGNEKLKSLSKKITSNDKVKDIDASGLVAGDNIVLP